MARQPRSQLKFNAPLGRMPVLQFAAPFELGIDPAYQRSMELETSQSLIRNIARQWDWNLCLPLVVSRRAGGELFVIDGQHRLAAARMRGDIAHLPCVVVEYDGVESEAASFVQLNTRRRPLTRLDVFKAELASGDAAARGIARAIADAGLQLAPHSNYTAWKPGMVSNIGGIAAAWRNVGEEPVRRALAAMAHAWPGKVLRYAGTLFPGFVALAAQPRRSATPVAELARFAGARSQAEWRALVMKHRSEHPNRKYADAARAVFFAQWQEEAGPIVHREVKPAAPVAPQPEDDLVRFVPDHEGLSWCAQCDRRVTRAKALACESKFCGCRAHPHSPAREAA